MKNRLTMRSFLLGALFLSGAFVYAQTDMQAQKFTSLYNKAKLSEFSAQTLEKAQADKQRAIQLAQLQDKPISYTTEKGDFVELQRVLDDGTLLYYTTYNADAAHSTRVDHLNTGGSTGFDLDGQNMVAHEWDGGHPRASHQEYGGRVTVMDAGTGGASLHYHSAHVAGTIMAAGVEPQAKGMAPKAELKAYEWNNDLSEATSAASSGMLVSNHSYGYRADQLPDWMFGAYIDESRDWDDLMYNAPYYLMLSAAGNDGTETFYNGNPLEQGYDMLSGHATAKNNLVVAAADDANVDSQGNLVSVSIANFSSPGPTDDYRIKPDITGNGVNLYSTYDGSDTDYGTISGTSMATPNVTGSLLLLQEHYNNLHNEFMRAATLKGLALHTADDAGPSGPDATWGWGLLNAKRAAETISANGETSLVEEREISQGQTITLEVEADGVNDLQASISWTDPAGTANSGTANSSTAVLVNDLDVRVSKGSTTYYPWRLTSATANEKGDNTVDPYERVDVANASGTYTITITHKGSLSSGSQKFSLIVTGIQEEDVACTASMPQNLKVDEVGETSAKVSWDAVTGANYDLRYRETSASNWTVVYDLPSAQYQIENLDTNTEYEVQVRSKCSENETSDQTDSVTFTTDDEGNGGEEPDPDPTPGEYCEAYSSEALSNFYIRNVYLNGIDNTSGASTYSDFTNESAQLSPGQSYNIYISSGADANYFTYYAVYIDYNNDGEFGADELVYSESTSAYYMGMGSFTVPSDVSGSTRMRVILSNDPINGPCDTDFLGEVEDYTVQFGGSSSYDTLSNRENDFQDFSFYPNPVESHVNLEASSVIESVTLYDLLGKRVKYATPNQREMRLNLEDLQADIYLMKVTIEGTQKTFRLVKK